MNLYLKFTVKNIPISLIPFLLVYSVRISYRKFYLITSITFFEKNQKNLV